MKRIFNALLVIAFICCSGSIHGMKRQELATQSNQLNQAQEESYWPDEVVIPLAAYSKSKQKNKLMQVSKQFHRCFKEGRDQIIYANPWAVAKKDRAKVLFNAVRSEGAYPGGIRQDKYELVEKLLKTGSIIFQLEYTSPFYSFFANILGKTPLHYAIEKNNKDMENLLLAYDADINNPKPDVHPLLEAVYESNLEQVQFLLESGTDVNVCTEENLTPLYIAIHEGHTEIVKLLVKYGANINIKDDVGSTPLDIAIWRNNANIVKILLCADGLEYIPPLVNTIARQGQGLTETMKCLLCVDTVRVDYPIDKMDSAFDTAFYHALSTKEEFYKSIKKLTDYEKKKKIIELIKVLLNAGAAVHGEEILQYSPLHMAVEHNHCPEVIQLLLDKGADVNLQDYVDGDGNTALHLAAENGNIQNVKLLLAHDADPEIKNIKEETALMLAEQNKHPEIVTLLTNHETDRYLNF